MSDKDQELVLCVQSSAVRDLFGGRTWLPCDEAEIDNWLAGVTKAFLPRSIAERDESWRHLATYCVITSGDKVFAYRRGKSGTEGRIHGLRSVGVGGHVAIGDFTESDGYTKNMLANAALREIDEELYVLSGSTIDLVGLIADDSTPVDRVHLGVCFKIGAERLRVKVREDCLAEPSWQPLAELRAERGDLETWSRIVLEHLLLPEGSPS